MSLKHSTHLLLLQPLGQILRTHCGPTGREVCPPLGYGQKLAQVFFLPVTVESAAIAVTTAVNSSKTPRRVWACPRASSISAEPAAEEEETEAAMVRWWGSEVRPFHPVGKTRFIPL